MNHGVRVQGMAVLGAVFLMSCGGGGDGGQAVGAESGATSSRTAKQVCDDACAALSACGSAPDSTCSLSCQSAGSAYVSCLSAANDDCNGIAVCILEAECGKHPPSGASSCAAAAQCEGTCNVQNPTLACGCSCVAAMSPATSFELIINNECANYATCPSCNPATFDGALCNACASACVGAGKCSHN
jgi:hypothetical protein